MIVEMRTYTLQPGTTGKFLAAYERLGLAAQKRILGNLVGYYTTEIGPLNQVIHMWGYESLDDRARRRTELFKDADFLAYLNEVLPLFVNQESKILNPTSFSPK